MRFSPSIAAPRHLFEGGAVRVALVLSIFLMVAGAACQTEQISEPSVTTGADGGSLNLTLTTPPDGLETSQSSVRVIGETALDAIVTVNGESVTVDDEGLFQTDVFLEEGPNLIEVVASQILGDASQAARVTVFYIP